MPAVKTTVEVGVAVWKGVKGCRARAVSSVVYTPAVFGVVEVSAVRRLQQAAEVLAIMSAGAAYVGGGFPVDDASVCANRRYIVIGTNTAC